MLERSRIKEELGLDERIGRVNKGRKRDVSWWGWKGWISGIGKRGTGWMGV